MAHFISSPLSARQQRWLYVVGWGVWMILMGVFGGLAVWWMMEQAGMMDKVVDSPHIGFGLPVYPWKPVLHGIFYSSVMTSSLLLALRFVRHYFPLRSFKQGVIHVAILGVVSSAALSLVWFVLTVWLGDCPVELWWQSFSLVASFAFPATFLASTGWYIWDFYRRMRQAENKALMAELSALRAQINPHFLFNTLNTIAALIRKTPSEAEAVVEELADLFRYILRASQYALVPLSEEVACTRMYLSIEQVRFQDRLKILYDVPGELGHAQVPGLALQPLVENAVKHGASCTEGVCLVKISARKVEDTLWICVRDTGPGFESIDPEVIFNRGSGLANVRDRLRLLFGARANLQILDDGVTLCLPYQAHSEGAPGVRSDSTFSGFSL